MSARREGDAKHNAPALPACGLALLAGALLVQTLPQLPPRWLDWLLIFVVPAQAGIHFALRQKGHQRGPVISAALIFLAVAAAAFGWTALRADMAMQSRLPHALEGRDLAVIGSIEGLPQAQPEATRFEFDVARASLDGETVPLRGKLRLSWYASRHGAVPDLQPCTRWRLRVR